MRPTGTSGALARGPRRWSSPSVARPRRTIDGVPLHRIAEDAEPSRIRNGPRLVGGTHLAAVDSIQALIAANRPSLIAIFGEPGTGKTRVVRELYRRLAVGQSFWPLDLVDDPPSASVDVTRKRVDPATVSGGDHPNFVWIGLRLSANQDPVAQIFDVLGQLTGQVLRFSEGLPEDAPRFASTWRRLEHLAEPAAGLSPAGPIIDGASLLLEGARLAAEAGARLAGSPSGPDGVIDSFIASIVDKNAQSLRSIAHSTPVVITVEDAHLAGQHMLQLFERVLAEEEGQLDQPLGLHLLLTATTAGRPFVATSPLFDWLADPRIEAELDGRRASFFLEPLTGTAAEQLVQDLFGKIDEPRLKLLIDQSGVGGANPLVLSLQRELLTRPGDFIDGVLTAAPERIRLLPRRLADIDERRLREASLDADVRGRIELLLAWVALGSAPVPLAVLEGLLGGDVQTEVDVLRYEFGWVRALDDGTVSVSEPWHEEFGRRLAADLEASTLLALTLDQLQALLSTLRWPPTQVVIRTSAEGLVLQYLNLALAVSESGDSNVLQLRRLRATALAGLGAVESALEEVTEIVDECYGDDNVCARERALALILRANVLHRLQRPDEAQAAGFPLLDLLAESPDIDLDLAPDCARWPWPADLVTHEDLVASVLDALDGGGPDAEHASFILRARRAGAQGTHQLNRCFSVLAAGMAKRDPLYSTRMLTDLAQVWFTQEEWQRATDLALAALHSPGFIYVGGEYAEEVCRVLVKAGSRCGQPDAVFRGGNALIAYAKEVHESMPVPRPSTEARLLNLLHPALNAALMDKDLAEAFLGQTAELLDAIRLTRPDRQWVWATWQRDVVLINAARCYRLLGDDQCAAEFSVGVGSSGVRPPGAPYGMLEFRHAAEAGLYLVQGGWTGHAREAVEAALGLLTEPLHMLSWETLESNGTTIAMLMQTLDALDDQIALGDLRETLLARALELCTEENPSAGAFLVMAVVTPLVNVDATQLSTPIIEAVARDETLRNAAESAVLAITGQSMKLRLRTSDTDALD